MLAILEQAALEHVKGTALDALEYAEDARVEWIPGYTGRYAGVWTEGDWGSISLWRLDSLNFTVEPVTMDAKGRVRLWGRTGTGCRKIYLSTIRFLLGGIPWPSATYI